MMSNDEIELEEGEIAEDSDDADSMDNHPSSSAAAGSNHQSTGEPVGAVDSKNNCAPSSSDNNPRPQKRTRKVTRTVKVKKKVKKKVPKRNLAQSNSSSNNNNNSNTNTNTNTNTSNSSSINTDSSNIGITDNSTTNSAGSVQPIDALWEQQIMMLQEQQRQQNQQQTQHQNQYDQQLSQILRAAAFDEDLRIFLPRQSTNQQTQRDTLLPSQQHNQLQQQLLLQHSLPNFQQQQPLHTQQQQQTYNPTQGSSYQPHQHLQDKHLAIDPNHLKSRSNVATSAASAAVSSHQQTSTQSPQESQPKLHQTPSSPDDESGKSSYEVISKMLTLLRNSTNAHDPSETDSASSLVIDDENTCSQQQQQTKSNSSNLPSKNYKLIPILIDGIDYTRYKLLSQYEPKFKNDPRLNQST